LYDGAVTSGTRDEKLGIEIRVAVTHQFKVLFDVDLETKPLIWIDSDCGLKWQHTFEWNPEHDEIIRRLARVLTPLTSRISVLSNYEAQLVRINHWMKHAHPGVRVMTPESAQGQEDDIVILDFADNRCTPLAINESRLKIALSRVRELLVIIGSFDNFISCYHEDDIKGNILQKMVQRLAFEQDDDCVVVPASSILNCEMMVP